MERIARIGGLGLFVLFSVVLINASVAPGILAQQTVDIEGRVTGVNTVSDPPTMSVTTDSGTGYILRAPNVASIATAQIGSRFKATGSVANGVFVATSVQILPGESGPATKPQAKPQGQVETVVGVITGIDTESSPPRITVDTGTGSQLTVRLPGPSRIDDLQIGASVTLTGTRDGNSFQATSFAVIARAEPRDDDDSDGDDDDNDDGNDNGGDDDDSDDRNDNGGDDDDSDDRNDNGGDDDNDDGNDNNGDGGNDNGADEDNENAD